MTLLTLGLLALGCTGLYLICAPLTTPRKYRKPRKPRSSQARESTASQKSIALDLREKDRYKFPPRSMKSPAEIYQYLCFENSNVWLEILGCIDRRSDRGYMEITYRTPAVESWSRLQKHLPALQSLLGLPELPEFQVGKSVITITVRWFRPMPEYHELTRYLPPQLHPDHSDTVTPYLSTYQRFRITGGSEAGKSPTAKNIALALGAKYGCIPILSNPQSYSQKNYWGDGFEIGARTHPEQYELILEVAGDVMDRGTHEREKPWKVYVFDELDSTVAFLDAKEQRKLKSAILMIIKQASHQKICTLFLGQSSAANLIPGTTKSDWLSLVTVAIGNTGFDAISKSPALTTKAKATLIDRYGLLLKKASNDNRANPDKATWVRPAVVFDPSNVELVILPPFS